MNFNSERALKVFQILINSFKNEELICFQRKNLPQIKFLPAEIKKGSYEHRCWLWVMAVFMRAKVNSDKIFSRAEEQYAKNPEMFLPEYLAKASIYDEISVFTKRIIDHLSENISSSLQKNARALEIYSWDPLNIFTGKKRYREIWEVLKTKNFSGWQEKIISLLILWFEENQWVEPLFGPPPLDIHVWRILFNTNIVKSEEKIRIDNAKKLILPFLEEVCEKNQLDTASLDGAMWQLSRTLCRRQPKFCHTCPIENHCESFLLSESYYRGGKLFAQPREKTQQLFLRF